jgi:adenine-specific DNA-methyltransferase
LFGIDEDSQAAEIASVNLMLKALEKHSDGDSKLPLIVGGNIKVANSLVSCDQSEVTKFFGNRSINPMQWQKDFVEIFQEYNPENRGFDIVVGNPPWGADLSEISNYLENSEYALAKGQYDSYSIFLELSQKILRSNGSWGFVVPDSIFNPEYKKLRQFLCTNFQLDKIVKLGEGFFDDVYRGSVVIIFTKRLPEPDHDVICMTLRKEDRVKVMKTSDVDLLLVEERHAIKIPQQRFLLDPNYSFDIAATDIDKDIMLRMDSHAIDWDKLFDSWRGVEFSGSGHVIQCPNCFKWDNPPERRKGVYKPKQCKHCKHTYNFDQALSQEKIVSDDKHNENDELFVDGEGVNRYYVSIRKYLDVNKNGIDYKDPIIYKGQKILVRKTGIGIYATVDSSNAYVPQVVFIFRLKPDVNDQYKLEYFLGLMNSRLMLYYYFKKFGELEWKSFPYLTPQTIRQLPLFAIDFKNREQTRLHNEITNKVAAALQNNGPINRELDMEIESCVMDLYGITPKEKMHIWSELGKVQSVRIIRETMGLAKTGDR